MIHRMQEQFHRNARQKVTAALLACLAWVLLSGPAGAQSQMGEPRDINFKVVNATTGEPGTLERLQIEYLSVRLEPVFDIRPSGSEFEVEDVPLKDRGKYLVTAWYQGVPYFWSIRGQKLVEDTTTLHVFDITRDLQNVHIPGMTILFRKGTSLVELEYMINVENAEQPQRTVLGDDYTFEMALPDDARNVEATYSRGPEPLPVPMMSLGGGRYGLRVPLTSGRNQIRVTASLPWRDGLEFEVGSNLAVAEWGFMVSPENLDVQAYELEPNDDTPVPGYLRFKGPALDAERTFDIRVNKGVPAGPKEDVFTEEVPDEELSDAAAEAGEDEDQGIPLIFQITPIVLIIILLAVRRRKAKKAE